jgi:hypothetical protein
MITTRQMEQATAATATEENQVSGDELESGLEITK